MLIQSKIKSRMEIIEKDGEFKLRFKTNECPNCPYKKECAKNNKYPSVIMSLLIHFSLKGKNYSFHRKGN